jgi:DnaJ family protein C protein 19
MTTPIIVGIGAITAAVVGRSLIRRGLFAGRGAAEEWVKGGFKAKMDRKEAINILGLRCVCFILLI